MNVAELEAHRRRGGVATHVEQVRRCGSHVFETRHRAKSGEIWDIEASISYSPIAGGRLFVFFRDIAERKRAEAALRESREIYSKLVESAPVGILVHRTSGSSSPTKPMPAWWEPKARRC